MVYGIGFDTRSNAAAHACARSDAHSSTGCHTYACSTDADTYADANAYTADTDTYAGCRPTDISQ